MASNPQADVKPLTLHAHVSGPNPHKVAIVLEFLKLPYQIRLWEFGGDFHKGVKGETFTRINENGRVPALEDPNTGVVAWESGAVINYLRRQYDTSNVLGPRGPTEQDRVDFEKWEYFLLTTLGPMSGQVAWFRYYNATKNEDALDRYLKQVCRCYDVLEGQLRKSNGTSIIPGGITAVDCHFEPWTRHEEFIGVSLDSYPLIKKWLGLMSERREVQDAYRRIKDAAREENPGTENGSLRPDKGLLGEVAAGRQ